MKYMASALASLFLVACKPSVEDKTASYRTTFEESAGKCTATYTEVIDFYIRLSKAFPEINVQTIGETDSGHPLHVVTFNTDGDFNFQRLAEEKTIMLINNGIHPGESDGIDATMLLYRDLAQKKLAHPEHTVLVTIPVYNIGGALNRNSTSRANQNGPESYGFRGNAQNYDLNRDFIKADTKNAGTFATIFHLTKPDIFIDNHVSNGADYQYTLTHLFTQHNKLGGDLGAYLHDELMPGLEKSLGEKGWDISPYVNVFNRVPESGFNQFMDYPRYSTGYTTLWNTLGMMVETHMLKPYKIRVEGTYELMKSMLEITEKDHDKIKLLRRTAVEKTRTLQNYSHNWQVDTTKSTLLDFKGFEADTLLSKITGFERLKYDQKRPFTKNVVYQNYFTPKDTVEIPEAYIIKKGWQKVLDRFDFNGIEYFELQNDTNLTVQSYKIVDYQTSENPYEGHYPHFDTKVEKTQKNIGFTKGDIIIPTRQAGIRYLLETLEPQLVDSFFNWNFFDTILQQKEGFSPYVFEDVALELLQKNQTLKDSFLSKKNSDRNFAQNWYAQLDWIFKRSPFYEAAHMQYPVYSIKKESDAAKILNQ